MRYNIHYLSRMALLAIRIKLGAKLSTLSKDRPIKQVNTDEIRALFPRGTIVLAAEVEDYMANLHALEQQYVHAAVDKRRREFSTGRMLAVEGLKLLHVAREPVLRGVNNEPLWPDQIVGSISHSNGTCIVAIARNDICAGIGIDIEPADADISNVAHLILRKSEMQCAPQPASTSHYALVRQVFSAKEAVFKAVFADAKRFIDFSEVEIHFDTDRRSFRASAPDDKELNKIVRSGAGEISGFKNFVLAGFYLEA